MVNIREFSLFLVLVAVTKLTLCAKTDVKVSGSKKTDNLRQTAAMGIALGMIKVHKKMESNVLNLLNNFTKVAKNSKTSETVAVNQLKELKKTMNRDKYAINILKNGLDLALNSKNVRSYRQALSKMAHGERLKTPENLLISDLSVEKVQVIVDNHLNFMRKEMSLAHEALKKVESNKTPKISFTSPKPKLQHPIYMNSIFNHDTVRLPQLIVPMVYEIDVESFYRFRRQNEDDAKNEGDSKTEDESKDENKVDSTRESQENFDENFGPPSEPSGGGGVTGLIASLSGGEGGSDVGALVGAISGVISSLFGPGGLDVPSLLSTGSSLIAGLLGLLKSFKSNGNLKNSYQEAMKILEKFLLTTLESPLKDFQVVVVQ